MSEEKKTRESLSNEESKDDGSKATRGPTWRMREWGRTAYRNRQAKLRMEGESSKTESAKRLLKDMDEEEIHDYLFFNRIEDPREE